jgi:hypothetical protein
MSVVVVTFVHKVHLFLHLFQKAILGKKQGKKQNKKQGEKQGKKEIWTPMMLLIYVQKGIIVWKEFR